MFFSKKSLKEFFKDLRPSDGQSSIKEPDDFDLSSIHEMEKNEKKSSSSSAPAKNQL
jgi:hypothetical protein